jgi:hypothetical protein
MQPLLLLLPLGSYAVLKSSTHLQLASVRLARESELRRSLPEATWKIRVDDRMFFMPPSDAEVLGERQGLSPDISDYYVAVGAEEGLTDEMKANRVGKEGRWHIFHLPNDAAKRLSKPRRSDRRHSVSSLVQLKDGLVMNSSFPVYPTAATYQHPLAEKGQAEESAGAATITEATVQAFYDDVVNIGDGTYTTRSYRNKAATEAATAYIKGKFESLGVTTCLQNFSLTSSMTGEPIKFTNVVGYIPGEGSGTVTVGAHYDSRPFTGTAPGAEDNGSGVVALLSVLKALKATSFAPRKHLYFVAFAGEEPGLLGSDYFAKDLLQDQDHLPEACKVPAGSGASFLRGQSGHQKDLHKAIAVDEVGWRSPAMAHPTVNLESYDWAKQEVLEHLAQASGKLNGGSLKVVHSNQPFGSDHMSWLDRDMKACLVINGDDENYPDYHMSSDTMSNVDIPYTAMNAKMILGGVMRMSGA